MDTMTKADPRALADAMLRQAQLDWEADRERADQRRAAAVSAALNAGMTLKEVAEAMNLSITRVHQIRDTR